MPTPEGRADGSGEIQVAAKPGDEFGKLAAFVRGCSAGDKAALARLQPERLQPHELSALARALLSAGLQPDTWQPDTWLRWSAIAKGIALAGHDGAVRLGEQLAAAGVAESRVTKLLTARGDAFSQLLPRLVRLMASKRVAINWRELGELVLKESSADPARLAEAEELRLRIAGPYFSARAHLA